MLDAILSYLTILALQENIYLYVTQTRYSRPAKLAESSGLSLCVLLYYMFCPGGPKTHK